MIDYHELVPVPAPASINTGLSPCHYNTMIELFGKPGRLTQDCSSITNIDFKSQLSSQNIGPFFVQGWTPAVHSLQAIFNEVHAKEPDLYAVTKSAGMLCCRAVRGSQSHYSNHSWGCAIDLKIESELDELGAYHVQTGILHLYPYFHAHGWFSGMGFQSRHDPMHFELADETVRDLYARRKRGLI